MKLDFYATYRPMIARPQFDNTYREYPSTPKLRPLIRCFWGSGSNFDPHAAPLYLNRPLNPDTCHDIIFIHNHNTEKTTMIFTGLSDSTAIDQWDEGDTNISIFAVRFYFWTMHFLSRVPLVDTLNKIISPDCFLPDMGALCESIFSEADIKLRIQRMEQYLLKRIDDHHTSPAFLNGVDYLLRTRGTGTLQELSRHLGYSSRQVQRIFLASAGITPIRLMHLVRYQFLWQDMLSTREMDYLSAVQQYGYVDQSHLIADFKKYHDKTPIEALKMSLISYTDG